MRETVPTDPLYPNWLIPHVAPAEAIVALLHPHAEVVIHDLRADRIAAIWNPMSHRAVGDPSLLSELPPPDDTATVLGPYEKVSVAGRRITSVTSVLTDAAGIRLGLMCVNLDRSPLDNAIDLLTVFAAPRTERPRELFDRDWRENIALNIDGFCRDRGIHRDRLDRTARLELVGALDEQGLFATRNAANHVALALGVSRATVYSLLKSARARP